MANINDITQSVKQLLHAKEQLNDLQVTIKRGTVALKRDLIEAGMDDVLTINFPLLTRRLNLDGVVRNSKFKPNRSLNVLVADSLNSMVEKIEKEEK